MPDLIVVACHGSDFIEQCQASLTRNAPATAKVYIDTAAFPSPYANEHVPGAWPTGCLLWAYQNMTQFDGFLLMQDSMTALEDPMPFFCSQWQCAGAVAWQRFPMDWDNEEQRRMVEGRYDSRPAYGIFGPTFYTDRPTLDVLAKNGLLPVVPTSRLESCATERAWAYAFEQMGMPVVGPRWNVPLMTSDGVPPFRKTFASRP